MTALDQYDRLESDGLWREDADAQRRDVIISFGHATLVMTDSSGRVLTHWSLPAVIRLNEGTRPALFAPEQDAEETLEINDDLMIDAIEKIRRSLLNKRPRHGRGRWVFSATIVAVAALLAVFWFPNAMRQQALSVLPASQRAEIGASVLGHLQAEIGARCQSTRGTTALKDLGQRLFGTDTAIRIAALPRSIGTSLALPGGVIVLDQDVIEQAADPAVPAGYALSAYADSLKTDPLIPFLDAAGLQATLRLLTTGEISQDHLRDYALSLNNTDRKVALPDTLAPAATDARIDLDAFLADAESRGTDLNGFEHKSEETLPILDDNTWVSLQGICN